MKGLAQFGDSYIQHATPRPLTEYRECQDSVRVIGYSGPIPGEGF
jgi:hypothetical protein